ncbi:hypothetical protein KCU88_g2013, partial [Aureobasidium melanogenum]
MANTAVLEDIRHVAEAETHVEMLPGTELMAEVAGIHLVHAHNRPNATVLVPQPTASPHDPLNWSKLWKTIVLTNQGLFVLASIITTLSIAPLTPVYMAEWNKSLTQVNLLTGVTVLCLGYANFVIIPCSDIFGRRPTLLVCALISLASCIWQALAKSYHSFLGARVLAGLGPAANESIMATVVADLYFLHQRGRYVGVYFWCYFVGLMIGPIISGNVAAHVSWRWFFWACTIVQVVEIVGLLLFSPETRRILEGPTGEVVVQQRQQQPSRSQQLAEKEENDKAPADEIVENEHREVEVEVVENANVIVDEHLGRGRPSRSQFNVIQPIDRRATAFATILRHVLTPVQIFAYPIIFWAAMSMGAAANALLCVNLAQSQALAAPPYNFTPANVGFANFALAVGAIVGLATADSRGSATHTRPNSTTRTTGTGRARSTLESSTSADLSLQTTNPEYGDIGPPETEDDDEDEADEQLFILLLDIIFLDESYPPRLLVYKARRLRHQSGNWALHAKFEEWDVSIKELARKFLIRPFQLLTTPICALVALYASFCYGILYMQLGAIPIIFAENRHWKQVPSELPFLAIMIGAMIGAGINVYNQLVYNRKSGGKVCPELRLPPMMLGSFLFSGGLFLTGWTADPKYHWIAPVIGLSMAGIGFFTIFQAALNYLVDTFQRYAASAIAANTFLRSCFAGAFPLIISPLYHNVGIPWGTSIFGFFAAALIPVPFFFFFYGKRIRMRSKWSRNANER